MIISFHPEADVEFIESINYYNELEKGLGEDFAKSIVDTLYRIVEYPNALPIVDENIHRSLVHRFPFGILYTIKENQIYVLAVMHLKRDANYWKKRI